MIPSSSWSRKPLNFRKFSCASCRRSSPASQCNNSQDGVSTKQKGAKTIPTIDTNGNGTNIHRHLVSLLKGNSHKMEAKMPTTQASWVSVPIDPRISLGLISDKYIGVTTVDAPPAIPTTTRAKIKPPIVGVIECNTPATKLIQKMVTNPVLRPHLSASDPETLAPNSPPTQNPLTAALQEKRE
mmetsp:Transcript_11163/g.20636  ORF Transcript_11163/g.20636 Transcript_11163/m.20636 type:complete len:184 (-) Transcript_11163:2655-3206(-)